MNSPRKYELTTSKVVRIGAAHGCLATALPGRRAILSTHSSCLLVPSFKLSTVGGRAFPVAGPSIWNNLSDNVTSAPTLSTFCQRLKTYLFSVSFPHIILD